MKPTARYLRESCFKRSYVLHFWKIALFLLLLCDHAIKVSVATTRTAGKLKTVQLEIFQIPQSVTETG